MKKIAILVICLCLVLVSFGCQKEAAKETAKTAEATKEPAKAKIGVVVPDLNNAFCTAMDQGITRAAKEKGYEAYMKEVFAECGDFVYLELPFHANYGGVNAHFGSFVYANFNLTLVDDGDIYIGDHVLIGPNVTIASASHPVDPAPRRKGLQYNRPVRIGNNVWIGANAVVLPGVTIGDNTVIGAGSVVTRDIPADCVAVGNPCSVLRKIEEGEDREHLL